MSRRVRYVTLVAGIIIVMMAAVIGHSQQDKSSTDKKKNGKKGVVKKVDASSTSNPVVVDLANWPPDKTRMVRLEFGLKDTESTAWDGRVEAVGCNIVRIRPWRFGPDMSVDPARQSWKCGTWVGPPPPQRVFDRHLPEVSPSFIRPGVLIELAEGIASTAKLNVQTPHATFTVDVGRIFRAGGELLADGNVWAGSAIFGYPVAARTQRDDRLWYDDPALAARRDRDEIAVSYLAYAQDSTSDAIYVRRRVSGKWLEPELVSESAGDHYRSAVGYDANDLWVVYSAQVDGNWDLYGRLFRNGASEKAVRLTTAPQPDFHPVLVPDRQRGIWLVWQGFRDGQSDILARRFNGTDWGGEQRISNSPANDWHPSAAALPGGGLAVAWDTYHSGNYDICCRVTQEKGDSWGAVVEITRDQTLEARPSIAADKNGRLWIAYDTAGFQWGKDTGFMLELAKAPQGTRLYESRGVAVAVLEPAAQRLLAPNEPFVRPSLLNRTMHEHVEYPQLVCDDRGRMWLVMRRRAMLSMSRRGVGRMFAWDVVASRFDADKGTWTEPIIVADSLGRLDSLSGLSVQRDSLWLAWSNDHRAYTTNRPDASSIFAGSLDLMPVPAADVSTVRLTPPPHRSSTPPNPIHPNETDDVARIRNHSIQVGELTYHIYRGDMHRHTETSSDGGGDGSMLDVYRYALDAAAMDFLMVTDHHDGAREYDWWRREKLNDLFRVGESFTGLYGYERSLNYPNGHRNVFFTQRGNRPLANSPQEAGREPIGTGKILYPHLRERGGICFGHTSATGMGTDWRDNDPELEPLVEIFQGDRTNYERLEAPWSADPNDVGTQEGGFQPLGYVNLALAKGYKLGFQASSDHLSTHLSYSCILAERNTREALMSAMKKRHAYAATDNILLDVRGQGADGEHIMGDIFTSSGAPRVKVKVVGTAKLSKVVLIKDDRVIYSAQPSRNETEFEFTDMETTKGRESYYYVRVEQVDRQLAWSSPMWITAP